MRNFDSHFISRVQKLNEVKVKKAITCDGICLKLFDQQSLKWELLLNLKQISDEL
jgi:hypothetical protein